MLLQNSDHEKRSTKIAGLNLTFQITWKKVRFLLIEAIQIQKANIIVFPEHALDTIALNSRVKVRTILKKLLELSLRFQVSIVPGTYSMKGEIICPLISRGIIAGKVKKHTTSRRNLVNIRKTDLEIFNIEGLRTCILICRDIERYQVKEIVQRVAKEDKIELIINPALIAMKNPEMLYMGQKGFKIARGMASENLSQFVKKIKCILFRVDWAESIQDGIIGTTLAINGEKITIANQQAEIFIIST
ncbi:MAG: hypothetical protein ACFFC7_07155 [Candidatus Hermodarchaeota archaeon]